MAGPEVTGAVLAGGRGSRIGGAKASAVLAGRPLAWYPAQALLIAGIRHRVLVAKIGTELPELGLPVVREADDLHHPAAGILAALDAANGRPVVVVAADMPFLSPGLLGTLAGVGDPERAIAPRVDGELEPLCARYPAAARAGLEAALEQRAPLRAALEALSPIEILDCGPEEVFNVNTAEDLAAAEDRLRRAPPDDVLMHRG